VMRPPGRGWRAGFAATLLWATTAATFLQFAIGVLAPFLAADLALSRTQIGLLTSVLFGVGALGSPIAGPLVDRLGGRRLLLGLFAVAGLGVLGVSASPSYPVLVTAVAVGGLATATTNPVTNALIADHLASGQRGVVMGVKQSGVQMGSLLAGLALPSLALALGWRGALVVAAIALLAGIAATVAVVPPDPITSVQRSQRSAVAPTPAERRFGRWLAAYALLMGGALAAVGAFVVLYSVEALGYPEDVAGLAAAVIGLVGVVSRVLWGRIAESLRTVTAPLVALAAAAVVSQAIIWSATVGPRALLWVGVVAYGASAVAWNTVAMLGIVREVRGEKTGWASGVYQTAFYSGFVVAPLAFGWLVDLTGSYDAGWAFVTGLFAVATLISWRWHAADRGPRAGRRGPPRARPPRRGRGADAPAG